MNNLSLSPQAPKNNTLAARAQASIRALIINRQLQPGERIDQNQLSQDLQVSLVPVREALKGLQAEGLVYIVPHRGAFVTEVSLDHLDDLYFARVLIEGEVAAHAVQNLTNEDYTRLAHLIGEMRHATDAHDIQRFMQLNRDFHMTIYDATNNQHLIQTVVSLWERSELYRYRYMFVIHNAEAVHAEHEAILDACRQRDPVRIKRLVAEHIQHTQRGLHQELVAELAAETAETTE